MCDHLAGGPADFLPTLRMKDIAAPEMNIIFPSGLYNLHGAVTHIAVNIAGVSMS